MSGIAELAGSAGDACDSVEAWNEDGFNATLAVNEPVTVNVAGEEYTVPPWFVKPA